MLSSLRMGGGLVVCESTIAASDMRTIRGRVSTRETRLTTEQVLRTLAFYSSRSTTARKDRIGKIGMGNTNNLAVHGW